MRPQVAVNHLNPNMQIVEGTFAQKEKGKKEEKRLIYKLKTIAVVTCSVVDRGKCSESTVVTEICLTKISPFRTETLCLSNF